MLVFGESGYEKEQLHITSHEVYHEGLLEAADNFFCNLIFS